MTVVLLVEDHPINRKLFRDLLEIEYEVLEAESAEAAEAILETRLPDLILMDLQLPGKDGLTLTRELLAAPGTQGIPVVALSAHALPRDIEQARAAGVRDYITKPITDDPEAILERLRRLLPPGGVRP